MIAATYQWRHFYHGDHKDGCLFVALPKGQTSRKLLALKDQLELVGKQNNIGFQQAHLRDDPTHPRVLIMLVHKVPPEGANFTDVDEYTAPSRREAALEAVLGPLRVERRCPYRSCGKQFHGWFDLDHSIDYSSPVLLDLSLLPHVDHPGQQMLPGL